MKKLVTSFVLGLAVTLQVAPALAQQVAVPTGAALTHDAPFIGTAIAHPSFKPQAAPLAETAEIFYVDPATEQGKYYFLPNYLRLNLQSGEFIDTMVQFGMRFTTPFPRSSTYLDSVRLILGPSQVAAADPNNIVMSLHAATVPTPQQPIVYFDVNKTSPSASRKTINANELAVGEPNEILIDYKNYKVPQTLINASNEFIIGVTVPYFIDLAPEEQNFIGVFGDSNAYGGEYDVEQHRLIYGGRNYQVSYSGITQGDGEPYYANLLIIAYLSNAKFSDVEPGDLIAMELHQNYPNPFNPSTTIAYALSERAPVTLMVYNQLGEVVEELVNETKNSGSYTVNFDASNLPSGTYAYTLSAGGKTIAKRMILAK